MTVKGYRGVQYGLMGGSIGLAFLLNHLFPILPWYFYLAFAVIVGAIMLPLGKRLERGMTEALSDERTIAYSLKATDLTFRVSFAATLLASCVLLNIPRAGADIVAAGRALMIVAVGQSILVTVAMLVFDRRSR
jgi:hypothetical protein